jgi:hypothetical protein
VGFISPGCGVILFLFALLVQTAKADVLQILNSKELLLTPQTEKCENGQVMAIFSQDGENEAIGFAEIVREENGACVAKVTSHSQSALIRVKDRAVLVDLKEKNQNLRGRYDLLREGKNEVAVRYKPLVFAGYTYGQTAATLDKGEFLLGLSHLMYGIQPRLQVDINPLLLAFSNLASGGVKYQFLHLEDVRAALRLEGTRFFNLGKGAWAAELQYDSFSNGRSMTHTKLRYTSKLPDSLFLQDQNKEKQGTAEISTVYEWILPSWHRILLGPKFTAGEEKDVGFLFTSLFLYKHFHWSINININSLAKFNLRENKQVISGDFFWRF